MTRVIDDCAVTQVAGKLDGNEPRSGRLAIREAQLAVLATVPSLAGIVSEDQCVTDTIWERLEDCVQYLSEPFRASEILGWFRRHHPDVKEQSLRAHIQGATSNASVESRGVFANRQPLITRIEHGVYRRFDGGATAEQRQPDRHRDTA